MSQHSNHDAHRSFGGLDGPNDRAILTEQGFRPFYDGPTMAGQVLVRLVQGREAQRAAIDWALSFITMTDAEKGLFLAATGWELRNDRLVPRS